MTIVGHTITVQIRFENSKHQEKGVPFTTYFGKGDAIEDRKCEIRRVAEPMKMSKLHELFLKYRSTESQIIFTFILLKFALLDF